MALLVTLSGQSHFLLPHEHNLLIAALKNEIASARERLVLITDSLSDYTLQKSLKQQAKKGVKIIIVLRTPADASALALYRNIELRQLHGIDSPVYHSTISMSLLQRDGTHTCLGTTALTRKTLAHNIALFTCNPSEVFGDTIMKLLQESTPYLQE